MSLHILWYKLCRWLLPIKYTFSHGNLLWFSYSVSCRYIGSQSLHFNLSLLIRNVNMSCCSYLHMSILRREIDSPVSQAFYTGNIVNSVPMKVFVGVCKSVFGVGAFNKLRRKVYDCSFASFMIRLSNIRHIW